MPWGMLTLPGRFLPQWVPRQLAQCSAVMRELLCAGMRQPLLRTKEIPWLRRGKTGYAGSLLLAPLSLRLRPWSQARDLQGNSLAKGRSRSLRSGTLWLGWGDHGPAFPLLPGAPWGDAWPHLVSPGRKGLARRSSSLTFPSRNQG